VIESLTYTNERGQSLVFSVDSVFHCNISKDVAGLSDVSATIFSVQNIGQDGGSYLDSRIESRDITIIGHIRERDKTRLLEIKRKMNSILNPHCAATLEYKLGNYSRVISCNPFNAPKYRRESVLDEFSIQLNCLNPFWRDADSSLTFIAARSGMWTFPWEIPESGFEFAKIMPSMSEEIINKGDAPTGMVFEFTAIGNTENPYVTNMETFEFLRFNIYLQAGDVLTVSTVYGDKHVTLKRDDTIINAIGYIDIDSTYLQLVPGKNTFMLNADSGDAIGTLSLKILHNNHYLGV